MLDLVFEQFLTATIRSQHIFRINVVQCTYNPSGLYDHLDRTAHTACLRYFTAKQVHLTERVTYRIGCCTKHCHSRAILVLRLSNHISTIQMSVSSSDDGARRPSRLSYGKSTVRLRELTEVQSAALLGTAQISLSGPDLSTRELAPRCR
jgi:hypothetical protein